MEILLEPTSYKALGYIKDGRWRWRWKIPSSEMLKMAIHQQDDVSLCLDDDSRSSDHSQRQRLFETWKPNIHPKNSSLSKPDRVYISTIKKQVNKEVKEGWLTQKYIDHHHGGGGERLREIKDDLEVFSTDDLGLDRISVDNFLTCLHELSSYTSGHLEVSESVACLEKALFSYTPSHVKVFLNLLLIHHP
ncbi:hypothetical protein Tco_0534650 [Tanacetum coccineum]